MMRVAALVLIASVAWADFINDQVNHAIPSQVSCTSASSVVSAYVPDVRARTILNQSSTDVYLCFSQACTTATGTRFQQNMGLIEQTYTGPISCITASGTATLGLTVR